jgi:hypothetical protein
MPDDRSFLQRTAEAAAPKNDLAAWKNMANIVGQTGDYVVDTAMSGGGVVAQLLNSLLSDKGVDSDERSKVINRLVEQGRGFTSGRLFDPKEKGTLNQLGLSGTESEAASAQPGGSVSQVVRQVSGTNPNETIPQGLIRALADKIRPGLNSLVGQEGSPNRNVPVVPPAVPNAPVTPPGPSGDFNQAMLEDMYDIGGDWDAVNPIKPAEPARDVVDWQTEPIDIGLAGDDFTGDAPIIRIIESMGLLELTEGQRAAALAQVPLPIRQQILAKVDEMIGASEVGGSE